MEPLQILLVDDSPGDRALVEEAVRQWTVGFRLRIVEDGEQALHYLRKEGGFSTERRPDLVLLDLDLPRKSGREVLAELKADESLRTIPVVILTTSNSEQDVLTAYGLHANCYMTKPVDMEEYIQKIRAIEEFWFLLARLPHRG